MSRTKKYTDSEILNAVKSGRDSGVLEQLYSEILPKIARFIYKNGGSEDEANDIFQDAVVIFYRHVKEDRFNEQYEIGGFLYSVSRNLWINYIKRKNRQVEISDQDLDKELSDDLESDLISEERQNNILRILDEIGEKCKQLLIYSVFEGMSMKEICELMGFSTENAAKTRNYKCKQRLIKLLEEKPGLKQYLIKKH